MVAQAVEGAEWHLYHLIAGDSSFTVEPGTPDVDGLTLWLEGFVGGILESVVVPFSAGVFKSATIFAVLEAMERLVEADEPTGVEVVEHVGLGLVRISCAAMPRSSASWWSPSTGRVTFLDDSSGRGSRRICDERSWFRRRIAGRYARSCPHSTIGSSIG